MARSKGYSKASKSKPKAEKWENLVEFSDVIVKDICHSHDVLVEMCRSNREVIEKDENLMKLTIGLSKNFTDLLEEVNVVRKQHIVSGSTDDMKTVKFKKGKVSLDDVDEILSYQKTFVDYEYLAHKVIENGQKGLLDVATQIGELVNVPKEDLESFEKSKKEISEAVSTLGSTVKEIKTHMDSLVK